MGCCHGKISNIRARAIPVIENKPSNPDIELMKNQLNVKKVTEVPQLNLVSNKLYMSRRLNTISKQTSNSEISGTV